MPQDNAAYRSFTSFRMTGFRFVVILTEGKDLCKTQENRCRKIRKRLPCFYIGATPHKNIFQSFSIASVPTRFRHSPNTSAGGSTASSPSPSGLLSSAMPTAAAGMASMV